MMTRSYVNCIVFLGLGLLSLTQPLYCWCETQASALKTNLILNGGFETPSDDLNFPLGWIPLIKGNVTTKWTDSEAHSGKRCIEMAADFDEKWGHAYWNSFPFKVKPGIAYQISFHYKAVGYGIPVFKLKNIKHWRLFPGDTKGEWIYHEDTVVIPPGITSTLFSAHNYHRRSKTLWVDDVSLYELPLEDSPLTKRLTAARFAIDALIKNSEALELTSVQKAEQSALQNHLAGAQKVYAELKSRHATVEDFKAMNAGLEKIEKMLGTYLFTLTLITPDEWEKGERQANKINRHETIKVQTTSDSGILYFMSVKNLIDEGLPMRVVLTKSKKERQWNAHLLVTPAYPVVLAGNKETANMEWGKLNTLGEVFLPPDVARFFRIELDPNEIKPGKYRFGIRIECLDRVAESGQIDIRVEVKAKKTRQN